MNGNNKNIISYGIRKKAWQFSKASEIASIKAMD